MISFSFRGKLWLYPGKSAWCFVTLPKVHGAKLKEMTSHLRRGWGSLRVEATLKQETWATSIFPDRKSGSYLLPIKASVRKAAGVEIDQTVQFKLTILDA